MTCDVVTLSNNCMTLNNVTYLVKKSRTFQLQIIYINSLSPSVSQSVTVTFMTVTPGQNGIYKT
jgi:hypothetical protein